MPIGTERNGTELSAVEIFMGLTGLILGGIARVEYNRRRCRKPCAGCPLAALCAHEELKIA